MGNTTSTITTTSTYYPGVTHLPTPRPQDGLVCGRPGFSINSYALRKVLNLDFQSSHNNTGYTTGPLNLCSHACKSDYQCRSFYVDETVDLVAKDGPFEPWLNGAGFGCAFFGETVADTYSPNDTSKLTWYDVDCANLPVLPPVVMDFLLTTTITDISTVPESTSTSTLTSTTTETIPADPSVVTTCARRRPFPITRTKTIVKTATVPQISFVTVTKVRVRTTTEVAGTETKFKVRTVYLNRCRGKGWD